ncbi:MAG: preprotein translocase subunit SecY [Brevinematales bacterium]|nr:preprotein translocase subunit SecY [Brevinematales bacterium]
MFKILKNILKTKELRDRFLFTIGMLIAFRIGVQIPSPGVDLMRLMEITKAGGSGGGLADFLNLFTGGARENASIFSLGVMPYITAMIILQLLKTVVPSIEQMLKEGPEGRKKFQQYGRLATVLVTIIQGVIFAQGLLAQNAGQNFLYMEGIPFIIVFTLSVTAGTLVLMWMGEQITERGIGNGISLIIMVGIVARLPHSLFRLFVGVEKGATDPLNLVIILLVFFVIIGFVVFEELGLRKIPIQHTNRGAGAQVAYLPFKVNPTGVIPIIFASSLLIFPSQLANWFGGKIHILKVISDQMLPGRLWYSITYFALILFFAYFYTEVEINPHDISENLRKSGAFIPGIRPGQKTEEHLAYILSRITLPGAIFLGIIALLPNLVINILKVPSNLGYLMGGTSLLIMVGVALETLKQVESLLLMYRMDGFLLKGDKKGL